MDTLGTWILSYTWKFMASLGPCEDHVRPDISLFSKYLLGKTSQYNHQFGGGLQMKRIKSTFFKCMTEECYSNLPQQMKYCST